MELASGMNTIIPLCAIGIRNGERKAKGKKKEKRKKGKEREEKNWKKGKRRKTKSKRKRDAATVWGEQRK